MAAEIRTYRQEVNDKYTDDFNSSIMVDAHDTKTKNEILRKIKYFKKKKNRLPDFIREERTRILTKRAEDEKAMLLSRSQNSLEDGDMKRATNKDPVNINLRSKQANDVSDGGASPQRQATRKNLTGKQSFVSREARQDP